MEDNWYEEQLEKCRREFKKTTDKMLDEWFSLTHEHIMKNYVAQSSTKATDDVRERITAFRQKDMPDVIYYKTANGMFSYQNKKKEGDFNFEWFRDYHEIYSALSKNNVEFRIGDVTTDGTIKEIYIAPKNHFVGFENYIDAVKDLGAKMENGYGFRLDSLAKAEEKKVLFTIDGRELFAGDKVWNVLNFEAMEVTLEPRDALNMFSSSPNFLTKEAAEKWIAYNQKSFSYQQIIDFIVNFKNMGVADITTGEKLINANAILNHFKLKESVTKQ